MERLKSTETKLTWNGLWPVADGETCALLGCYASLRKPDMLFEVLYKTCFLGTFAKLQKSAVSFVVSVRPSVRPSVRLSVRPRGTTGLPLHGVSLNLIFECFSRISRESSSFIKI
jgi:hypothetical protein